MRKTLLLAVTLLCLQISYAQSYNNEWIDFSKTYYKFKVVNNGLYRIGKTALTAIGLGNIPAEQFQLWRNGQQIPVYTSLPTGVLGAGDYIEFWGERNNGAADKALYLNADYQLTDYYSLFSDTAAYFLTVNTVTANNSRYTTTTNNVAANVLPAEPYFMHKKGVYFKDRVHGGYAEILGDHFFSSSYDKGEGFSNFPIAPSTGTTGSTLSNLFPFTAGPAATLNLGVSGFTFGTKNLLVSVNGTQVLSQAFNGTDYLKPSITLNNSTLSTGSLAVAIRYTSNNPSDGMVTSHYELTYPRQFNFEGQSNFSFDLPANASSSYLLITNFNNGSVAPVLYDVTNRRRYVAVTDAAGVKIVLQPSATARTLVLVSQDAANPVAINNFTVRNFINYAAVANQGDYLIISNSLLYSAGGAGNPVEQYRQYRASAAGGSFNARLIDIEQLEDQFAFGIRRHPHSIKRFIRFARLNFTAAPRYVFIIGKGVEYAANKANEANPVMQQMNFVPTFGFPGSDNSLSAEDNTFIPTVPIGRLSAINTDEVQLYLDKVKEYENAQATAPNTLAGKAWMKNVSHVVGASDDFLQQVLDNYMSSYSAKISDTLFGANVVTFTKSNTALTTARANELLRARFNEGMSLINYFGHSSATSLEYSLDDPTKYTNPGKYPLFIINGCNAGNLFTFNPLRLNSNEVISEKYVLARNGGSVGFIASSNLGLVSLLHLMTDSMYDNFNKQNYGDTYGNTLKQTITDFFRTYGQTDFLSRVHAEQITLHGDPALKLNGSAKPDYTIETQTVSINPGFVSTADAQYSVKARFYNIGRSPKDSVMVEFKQQYPAGNTVTLLRKKIRGIQFVDSVTLNVPVLPTRDKGLNRFTITVDPDNLISEISEVNNAVTIDVTVSDEEIRPVYPYNFAIVTSPATKLLASTADAMSASRNYVMEIDTTELFNSPLKATQTIASKGGVLEFTPGITFRDSTVYHWRTAAVPASGPYYWNTFSFVYLPASTNGFNQSNFYQHTKSGGNRIYIDSATRRWRFGDISNTLFIRSGIWATSTTQEAEMSVAVNGDGYIRNACRFSGLTFNVFDPISFKPWLNTTTNGEGLYGSWLNDCFGGREYNFEFPYTDTASRRKMMNFMDNVVPPGYYVVVRNFSLNPDQFVGYPQAFVNDWKADTALYGSGNSIYHRLKAQGFVLVDSFTRVRSWIFVYKKNGQAAYTPKYTMSNGIYDKITLGADCPTPDTLGYITSPAFGPAKAWREVHWRGSSSDAGAGDRISVDVIGVKADNSETVLYNLNSSQQDFNIAGVSAVTYPFLKLRMRNADSINLTPYQLRYWRLNYDPVPEGAVAPNIVFNQTPTGLVSIFDTLKVSFPFKNVSNVNFDSLRAKFTVIDKNNVATVTYAQGITNNSRLRPIAPGDTVMVNFRLPLAANDGRNTLIVEVNPDNDQREQYRFNNYLYRNFNVLSGVALSTNLLHFTARPVSNQVLVEWKAAVGSDFDHFEVETSTDGIRFNALGNINEPNPSNTSRDYAFLHRTPVKGYNYYRLKIVSRNGTVEYTPIRMVSFGDKLGGVTIAPNPFVGSFIVNVPAYASGKTITGIVLDLRGRELLRLLLQPGSNRIDMQQYPAGTYLLQLQLEKEQQVIKLQKQ